MNTEATVLSHIAGKFTTQTENLATEALAFILGRSVAARAAIRTLAGEFGCPCPDDLRFETQRHDDDGARPDLTGKSPDGKVRLLIEAKFWAGLTDKQPVGYLEHSLPSSGGILLFVAPEKRLSILWAELTQRVGMQTVPSATHCIRVGPNILALTSWRILLEKLIAQVDLAGDLKCVADLRQLAGLCDRMDSEAFLPLTSEEMTSMLGQRVVQFGQLANQLTDLLVSRGLGDVKGVRATGGHGWYGRYLRLKGYAAVLQFSALHWSKWGKSPLWLGIKGEDWKRSTKVRDALLRSAIKFEEYDDREYCFIPILLTTGVEEEKVIANALAQLSSIVEALPPPISVLISEPPASEMMPAG